MTRSRRLSSALVLAAALATRPGLGQAPPEGDPDITQTVARVSSMDGEVSYARGDDPDDWQPADRNVPMTLGDRVYTAPGSRLELELHGGDVIRLGSGSDLTALNLTEETRQFALKSGVALVRLRDVGPDQIFEVDSPNAAVTLERSGDYRIDVDADGNTRVAVHRGSVTIAAGGGQVSVGANAGIRIDGLDAPRYEVIALPEPDAWDRWAGERESRALRSQSRQYVSPAVAGVEDLDEYGRWQRLPEYGWVWSPTSVEAGWAPYRAGRWIWQDPWGWTWVSAEPWGWAPYHSGRWVLASSRWCWVPVAPTVQVVPYAPALVAFVGGGPGFSASVTIGGGGFVGWFPLAPREPLVPWWGLREPSRFTQVTNVTYVNRTSITVVNQATFVSGRPVSAGVVTDREVVRQVSAAPVVRGTIPVIPTSASTRVSLRSEATAPRPPSAAAARPVVARVAPPPAPARFDEKLAMIRQSGGAPVASPATTREAPTGVSRPAAAAVRPAAPESGKVTLAPRGGGSVENIPQRVESVAPAKGRPLATQERPTAAAGTEGSSSRPAPLPEDASNPASAGTRRPVSQPEPKTDSAPPPPPASRRPDARPSREPSVAQPAERQSAPPTPRASEARRPAPQSVPRAVTQPPDRRNMERSPAPPERKHSEPARQRVTPSSQGREPDHPDAKNPAENRRGSPAPENPRAKERPEEPANGRKPSRPPRPTPAPPAEPRSPSS